MDPLIDPQMAEWLRQKKEALGAAYESDEAAQEDETRRALLMQFAQSYANQRPTAVAPRQVDDARSRFGAEYGLEKDARSSTLDALKAFAATKGKAPRPGDAPAPAEWGAPEGMTSDQAIRAGYARKPDAAPEGLEPELLDRAKKAGVPTSGRKREPVIADILAAERAEADRLESSRRRGEEAKAGAAGDAIKTGGDLRREYLGNPMVRRTQEMAEANAKIQDTSPTGPGDISLLIAYMKMVDPGSTVRENEFATAENAGGVSSKVRNVYNKLLEGDKLPPEMREQFRAESRQMFGSQRKIHGRVATEYGRLAKQAGLRPEDVVIDLGLGNLDDPSVAGSDQPPVPGAVKSKSGRWIVKNADGKWEYVP